MHHHPGIERQAELLRQQADAGTGANQVQLCQVAVGAQGAMRRVQLRPALHQCLQARAHAVRPGPLAMA